MFGGIQSSVESEYCVSTLFLTEDIERSHSRSFCTFKIASRYLYDFTAKVVRVIQCVRSTGVAVCLPYCNKKKNRCWLCPYKSEGTHLKPGENTHTVEKAGNDALTNNEITAHWSAKRQVFVPSVGSPHLCTAFVFTIV